jgi:MSHA pilin protein MshD
MSQPANASSRHRARGITLIELIVSLTVIAIAGVALAGTLGFIARNGGIALAEVQARAIAEAYLAEALARPFADPALPDNETNRAAFDDVGDYNGLNDASAVDQLGTAISGSFQVTVTVVPSAGLPLIPAANVRRVDVTVRTAGGMRVVATGYRTNRP